MRPSQARVPREATSPRGVVVTAAVVVAESAARARAATAAMAPATPVEALPPTSLGNREPWGGSARHRFRPSINEWEYGRYKNVRFFRRSGRGSGAPFRVFLRTRVPESQRLRGLPVGGAPSASISSASPTPCHSRLWRRSSSKDHTPVVELQVHNMPGVRSQKIHFIPRGTNVRR
jgi:hypothetical protein